MRRTLRWRWPGGINLLQRSSLPQSHEMYDPAVADGVLALPTEQSSGQLQASLASYGSWFYRFPFTNGYVTEAPDDVTQAVHDSRARLIFPLLDQLMGDRWGTARCVDLACHEGWFAAQLAARGAASVLGLDIRAEHVRKANAIQEVTGLETLSFRTQDLYAIDADELGTFDVSLFLGVLYHLDNPVWALRTARALTRGVCVIETQVARAAPQLDCLWGSGPPRSGPAIALVPSDDIHVEGGRALVLVPTLDALYEMLHSVGFRHVSLAVAPSDDFAQFTDRDRVVVFALA